MIKPSETKAFSPYFLPSNLQDTFWAIENDLTDKLRENFSGLLEYAIPEGVDRRVIACLAYWLADQNWSVVVGDERLVIFPRPITMERQLTL